MKILQLLKADLAGIRKIMAADYRRLRKENPAKAKLLFRRMRAAMATTERSLQANLCLRPPPDAKDWYGTSGL